MQQRQAEETLLIKDANPAATRLLQANLKDKNIAKTNIVTRAEWWNLAQNVLTTGESGRTELWDETLKLWFEVGASRVDDSRVAVLFQDITERKRHANERDLMVGELNHRVKNMLAVVQSISRQTLKSAEHPEAFTETFQERLDALAQAHNVLTQDHWRGANLKELAEATLQSFSSRVGDRFALQGPPAVISPNATISVAMALHELATNAMKYGALSTDTGSVTVQWEISDGNDKRMFNFSWNENGGPVVSQPTRKGFGGRLLKSVAREFGGLVEIRYAPGGLKCNFQFPVEGVIKSGTA